MKAIQVSSFGPPEVLRLTELPDPAPGPGEVAIDVTRAAVGLIDVFIRQGRYRDRPGYLTTMHMCVSVWAPRDAAKWMALTTPYKRQKCMIDIEYRRVLGRADD